MAVATANRLLPLLAGSVLLILAFVTIKSCSNDAGESNTLASVPKAPSPDADSPADTIKTLTANVAAMTAEVQALRQNNDQLHAENRELLSHREQIEENVATRVQRELIARQNELSRDGREEADDLASLTSRVDALTQSIHDSRLAEGGSDMPVGLGFDDWTPNGAPDAVVWIEPLDAEDSNLTPSEAPGLLRRAGRASGEIFETTEGLHPDVIDPIKPDQPVYTVPRNATLIGSTAMTALVGRIPVQGQVRDPMPFKVITGAENLAANGLTVPGVSGMVWSGTAIGDWTLSCVTGRLDSVTFVFDDGTIRTISSDGRGDRSGSNDQPLGWISDERGIPCISGERKTNAPAFLAQRIGVMAVQAAAEAAANAETTSVVTDAGSVTNSVTGQASRYVLGKTFSGGSEEIAKWLLERQAQSFDAVFVPAGISVAIHVDHELPIDFETTGRKLHHEETTDASHHTQLD